MTPQEQALQCWRQDRPNYEKKARRVINDLCESLQMLPSSSFEGKLEELKEYLRYSYTYDEEDNFLEVYVHSIAGKKNISLMELANRLVEEIGGTNKFWQKKITDIATYVMYHPELSLWEVNNFYQRYLGLDPESAGHLRKKKSLAKKYLANLSSICKLIDKSKPFQEDLVKLDELFLKVKRSEEEYFAFVEQVQNRRVQGEGVSSKGILNAKKSLFLFLKPKEPKLNTLINYNFKCRKSADKKQSKLMDKQECAQFDWLLEQMRKQRQSQKFNNPLGKSPQPADKPTPSVQELRGQFLEASKQPSKPPPQDPPECTPVYIWNKQFFFSYCGHPVGSTNSFDYTSPFERYANVNYEIDSEEEYDELLAQDVDLNDSEESNSLDNDQNSFVVSDCHDSDREEEQRLKIITDHYFQERWVKNESQLSHYTIYGFETVPLPLQEDDFCQEEMIGKASGKSRAQIVSLFEQEKKAISKMKIDHFLKNNFKKMKSKDKRIIYVRLDGDSKDKKEPISDNESATNDQYEVSISYASRPKKTDPYDGDATIIEEQDIKSSQSNRLSSKKNRH